MDNKPKHLILSNWIREQILDGSFSNGSKLLSENELAEQFGFSRQTVRQAIGTLVNEGLLERKRGSGTFISFEPESAHSRTNNIAVITTYLNEYIFPGVIKGIDKALTEHGYRMNLGITYNKTRNEYKVLTHMLESGVDGFLIEPSKSAFPTPNHSLYREMMQRHIPVVFLNGYYAAFDFPYVTMDDYMSGKTATQYLINHGHKRIFGIFKSDDIQGHFRYSGCINVIKENHLEYDDQDVLWYVTEDLDRVFSPDNDRYLLARIGDCTAIVCYNDEIAVKLLEVFRRNGKHVPEDYSIISFDNSNLATLGDVGLTTIDYPADFIGQTAAEKLVSIIENQPVQPHTAIKPTLIPRNSVRML